MLRAERLVFTYPSGPKLEFPDIRCQQAEQVLLLGQSGSGKTTLLQLLGGLRKPDAGQVVIGDTVINRLSTGTLDRFRGRQLGIIFQTPHFVRALSVEDNLLLAQRLAGQSSDRGRVAELLQRLDIPQKASVRPDQLSVGEQQRVAIARALVNRPLLILADEPTSALDDKNAAQVVALLSEQATADGATLLIVTHDQRLKDKFSKQIHL
ncbi:MAG: ATP-binding cassette domain-containing protein [Saprospiraceae bacterium]|nr:ATP-binding cassette domain-containing protein [Lewinella sp.]